MASKWAQYHHPDHLSVRLTTDTNGTLIGQQGHYLFGESWYSSGTTTPFVFTSYQRDLRADLDCASSTHLSVAVQRKWDR